MILFVEFNPDGPTQAEVNFLNANGQLLEKTTASRDRTSATEEYDPENIHPYDKLDFTKGPDGKVTAAHVTLDPEVLAAGMSIGQIFGSAIGGALGGNSLVGNLASSTIGGLIGQKFVQVLATAMTADLSTVSLNDVFAGQDISVANAGFGAVSSFLTAELGHALHIDGFSGQLFNTAVSGFTTSLLIQVKDEMVRGGLDFAGAIASIDWTQAVSNAIDVAEINLGNLLGAYLGHELVPAQTREGAIGGQLFGAIGSFILPGGLGSLIGTILGTWMGNQFGTQASPSATDLLDQAGDHYESHPYQSADQGSYEAPDKMGAAAASIINAYLGAVDGAALDHSKQVVIGYSKNPDVLYITGTPTNPNRSFTDANDAVHAAALDVLQNLEVIGGNLLMKRAHQYSPSNIPEPAPAGGGMPGQSQVSGADQLATMAGDLSVAQDYENYLNNREAINALIAANPNSAFAAGWFATFARVKDLGLNQYGQNDFLGGLVGYLDSVAKAGLGFTAANASVNHSGNSIIIDVKVANGADIPGALSVFASQTNVSSNASGTTVQFVFSDGFTASGFHPVFGQSGDTGNDFWFGSDSVDNNFDATASTNAILVGGASNDAISSGNGWDFIDGGPGHDALFSGGGNDILRGGKGADALYGGSGGDTYVFARGDGADTVIENFAGGFDSLVFDPGIGLSDISIRISGNDLIVGVRDPAHPGVAFSQLADTIKLQDWFDTRDTIEVFRFADGATLDLTQGVGAFTSQKPTGAILSGRSVAENSASGTAVGTVTGLDLYADATLRYSLADNPGGRFAIDASSGELSVANGLLLDYETAASHQITVRVTDQSDRTLDKVFTIGVTDVSETTVAAVRHAFTHAGDFNGDGRDDVLWRHDTGVVSEYWMNGTAITGGGYVSQPSNNWSVQGIGDFNGDGKSDILWRHDGGTVSNYLMNGTAISGGGYISQPGNDWTIQGVGDFNGDGKSDILWRNADGTVAEYQMDGTAISGGSGAVGKPGNDWTIQGVGDFNGDGKSDILWRHDGGTVSVYLMNGTAIAGGGGYVSQPGNDWSIQGIGDFNGDHRDDILWRNADGTVAEYLMDGAAISGGSGGVGKPGND